MIVICKVCRIPSDDVVCHELGDCPKWPRAFDVERCECGAVTSFAVEVSRDKRGKVMQRYRVKP